MKKVLGTFGLVVATASQPALADFARRDDHEVENHHDVEPERRWTVPVDGPVDISSFLAGPVRVTVGSAGNVRLGMGSTGTLVATISEVGEVGEEFKLSAIDVSLITPGVRFVGRPTLTADKRLQTTARIQSGSRVARIRMGIETRLAPSSVVLTGLGLEADRELTPGTEIQMQVAVHGPGRLTDRRYGGQVGRIVPGPK